MTTSVRFDWPPSAEVTSCPWPAYAALRDEGPIYRAETGEYIISRHADIREVLRHDNVLVRHPTVTGHELPIVTEIVGEEHRRRRLMLAKVISPGRLKRYEPMIRGKANELIDVFIDGGEVELIGEFAVPFAGAVMPAMFDLTDHDDAWFHKWAAGGVEGAAIAYLSEEDAARYVGSWDWIYKYARSVLEERLADPQDDLLTEMIESQRKLLGHVDLDELMVDVGLTIGGGLHTTSSMIGSTMALLLRNPELLATVQSDLRLLQRLLEESLRVEAPVQWQPRDVLEDLVVAATPIPAGSTVILLFGAGNRDSAVYRCPEAIDLDQADGGKHLSFGFGPHACFGAPLARLEGKVAFEALLGRLTDIRLADGEDSIVPHVHPEHRGVDVLRMTFTAA